MPDPIDPQRTLPGFEQQAFRTNPLDDERVAIHIGDTMTLQAQKLAEHEGKIAGLSGTVGALVTFKGALQALTLGVSALMIGGLGIVFTSTNSASVRSEKGIESLHNRVSMLETKVDGLPGAISTELRATSRDLILITQNARQLPQDEKSRTRPK